MTSTESEGSAAGNGGTAPNDGDVEHVDPTDSAADNDMEAWDRPAESAAVTHTEPVVASENQEGASDTETEEEVGPKPAPRDNAKSLSEDGSAPALQEAGGDPTADAESRTGRSDVGSVQAAENDGRPEWKRPAVVVLSAVCVVALIAAAVFGVLLHSQNARESARADALRAGAEAAATLLSYDHTTLDADMPRRLELLTSDYRQGYESMVADRVAPAAKARQVVTESSVVASSVVDIPAGDRAVLLLFVNQSSRTPALQEPLLTGSRVQMTLDEVDGRWLVSELQPL